MRDRLDVGCAVAVLDEETLIIFQPVGGAGDRIVQPVGVVVLDPLAGALLHVGGRHDPEIDIERHAQLLLGTVGRLHHQLREIVALVGERIGDDDLAAPARAELRHELADEIVAAPIAPGRSEDRLDVLGDGRDTATIGDEPPEPQALRIGIPLGHQHAQHLVGPKRLHRERRRDARIDAAREPQHDAALAQAAEHLRAQRLADPLRFRRGIEAERLERKPRAIRDTGALGQGHGHSAGSSASCSIWRRLILPDSVLGSAARNSTSFGTMKSSRCRPQCRMTS